MSTMRSMLALMGALFMVTGAGRVNAGVVTLTPSQDTTLYESAAGPLSNGAGQHLFVGANGDGLARRTLLQFDVAGAISASSIIESVSLSLNVSQTSSGATSVALHRVLSMWAEGTADAMAMEGGGAPAVLGDATWEHAIYDSTLWSTPGGDFDMIASASATVSGFGLHTWGSTDAMVADAQSWLDDPGMNFGWIMLGDESMPSTTKRFDSTDHPNAQVHPMLTIGYVVPSPGAATVLAMAVMIRRRRRE